MKDVTLINDIPDLVFSSDLPDLCLQSDGESVDVSISTGGSVIFHTTLWLYNHNAFLRNAREIVENHMIDNALSFCVFNISFGDGVKVVNVIFCDRLIEVDAATFARKHFLTSLNSKVADRNTPELLSFFCSAGEDITEHYRFALSVGGVLKSCTINGESKTSEYSECRTVGIDCVTLTAKLREAYGSDVKVLACTVVIGKRAFTVYFKDGLCAKYRFIFRNAFNCFESLSVISATTVKTKVDRDIAVCGRISRFYNQSVEKSFESVTATVLDDEAEFIEQFISSHEVVLFKWGEGGNTAIEDMRGVIVTDSTFEINDGSGATNSVKFTWRFADDANVIVNAVLPDVTNIFTDEYSIEYA